jgi:hypothetical protein
MGITVSLRTETGEQVSKVVADDQNFLHELLPPLEDNSYCCLRFVDWYGDTVFNHLQMGTLLEELARLSEEAPPDAKELLEEIAQLAETCQRRTHVYLAFIGD